MTIPSDADERSRFACKCGKCQNEIRDEVVAVVEALEKLTGPLKVTSGYRCPEHNEKVGGSSTSSHLYGWAVDLQADGSRERFNLVWSATRLGVNRIGLYPGKNFVHIDLDPAKDPRVIWFG